MKRFILFFTVLLIQLSAFAQNPSVTTSPAEMTLLDAGTLTFDVTGTALAGSSDVYIWGWAKLTPTGESDFKTNNSWSSITEGARLSPVDGEANKFTLTFPLTFTDAGSNEITVNNLAEMIGKPANQIDWIGYLLRDQSGSAQTAGDGATKIPFAQLGFDLTVATDPINTSLNIGESITITGTGSSASDMSIYKGEEKVAEALDSETVSYTFTATEGGLVTFTVKAEEETTLEEIVEVTVKPQVTLAQRPDGLHLGANYHNDDATKVTLVLQDPAKLKEYVYAIGDFSDWNTDNTYLMNKSEEADANYFWIELTGLEAGKEYIYQYFIDHKIKIADPYTEKVSDYDDKWINEGITRYPNLVAYPEEKTEHRASVFQTNQSTYTWSITDFERPAMEELMIYEMHIRDFTEESTFNAAMAKLDYLKAMGINCIELMPVNEFEGNDSWGYNPNFYFALDKYYGTKDDFKSFVDACHANGMAVVIDMVLNHSFHSSPFVRMYNNGGYSDPSVDNPWLNTTSPNATYSWGADFNHESVYTEQLVDSVNIHWLKEYNIDGYRFDFTKGFTQTVSNDGGGFDQSRINILKRMASAMWAHEGQDDAYIILEHFAPVEEERQLADHGMAIWANGTYDFLNIAKGGANNFDWLTAQKRGMPISGLVSFMESHDEERMMFDALNHGKGTPAYDLSDEETALNRMKLSAAFFLPLPGAKMIWQFGELGYDVSINQIEKGGEVDNGHRTGRKPVLWDYENDAERAKLYKVYSALNKLRHDKGFANLTGSNATYSFNGDIKSYELTSGSFKIKVIGNFGVATNVVDYDYSADGNNWFSYFEEGQAYDAAGRKILGAGEFVVLVNEAVEYPEAGLLGAETPTYMINPSAFMAKDNITLTFFPEGTALAEATEVYAVVGIVEEEGDDMENVVDDNTKGLMTQNQHGEWEITFTPEQFLSLNSEPDLLAFYFRNGDASVMVKAEDDEAFLSPIVNPKLYIVGNIEDIEWSPANSLEMTKEGEGIYSIEVELDEDSGFKFIGQQTGWDIQYGRSSGGDVVKNDGSSSDFKLPADKSHGVYKVTMNTITLTITFELVEALAVEDKQLLQNKVTVYPNPFTDGFTLTMTDKQYVSSTLTLFDVAGKMVKSSTAKTGQKVYFDNLKAGFYYLHITTGNQTVMKKVIKK